MTGYHIEVGYNGLWTEQAVEDRLREVVKDLCADPGRILREVWCLEGVSVPKEFAECYREPWKDSTIAWVEATEGGRRVQLMQLASGGDPERSHKEACRRAFCRLVLEAMHKERMEVSIIVA